MLTLSSWKNRIAEDIEKKVKDLFSKNGSVEEAMEQYPVLTEEEVKDFYEEHLIEKDVTVVEEYDSADLNPGEDCDCDHGDFDCLCPEEYYEFIPGADGEEYDLEYEMSGDDLPSDDAIDNWVAIKKAMFKEGYLHENGDIEVITENQQARVIFKRAKGAIVKKKKCAVGFKLKGRKCIKQTGTDRAGNRRLGIKLKRAKKAQGVGKKKRAALKAKITKRKTQGRARTFGDL